MLWQRQQIFHSVLEKIKDDSGNSLFSLFIEGEEGMGKGEFVRHLVQELPERFVPLLHFNFAFDYPEISRIPRLILGTLPEVQTEHWERFLKRFPRPAQQFISRTLSAADVSSNLPESWYSDLFLQFLDFLAESHSPVFVQENIHLLDASRFQEYARFLTRLSHYPILTVFTGDFSRHRPQELPEGEVVHLTKLSVSEVERSIAGYFGTQPINARLITNHCYIKTNGNPLKIRFLLEGVYRPLVEEAGEGFIRVERLRTIRIGPQWEDLFQVVFQHLPAEEQRLLGFLAHLNAPIFHPDALALLEQFVPEAHSVLERWQKAGFLEMLTRGEETRYLVYPRRWQHWLKEMMPLEKVKDILEKLQQLETAGQTRAVYKLSPLFYELGEMEVAIPLAEQEGEYFTRQGNYTEAADRFFFVVRIASLSPASRVNLETVLEKLGDLYLHMGAYENAFDVLRQLRDIRIHRETTSPREQKGWIDANLKMIRTLIAMDAFQEARYLIREVKVKDFADEVTRGLCEFYLGEVEETISRSRVAVQHYQNAYQLFRRNQQDALLAQTYRKLKPLLRRDAEKYREVVEQTVAYFTKRKSTEPEAFSAHLDLMQIYLNRKQNREAILQGVNLLRMLRRVFFPQMLVQTSLYLADLYAQMGKWRHAVAHLRSLVEKNRLRYNPALQVQVLIHLGMIYKEQGAYGEARKILEQALHLSVQHRFFKEQYEIKLHLGHLYLLVHALLHAVDYLNDARRWAEEHEQPQLIILSHLYLAYYEMQNHRPERMHDLLVTAKKYVNTSGEVVDYLNYLFYYALYLLEVRRPGKALRLAEQMLKKASDWARYRAAAFYLQGMAFARLNQPKAAGEAFQNSREIARNCHYPQILYLVECEWVRLLHNQKQAKEYQALLKEMCGTIRDIAHKIEDEILRQQFLEARYHEDIRAWCAALHPDG